jgi:hypothetical protein
MQSLKSLRTLTTVSALAVAGVLAAAPLADAAIGAAGLNAPTVADQGKTLNVPVTLVSDEASSTDTTAARNVADSLVGSWIGDLMDYAERNTPPAEPSCQVTATATDPDGATGTASASIPAGTSVSSLAIADQTNGTVWGVGDLDHFTLKFTCTDAHRNAQLSQATIDQEAVASAS